MRGAATVWSSESTVWGVDINNVFIILNLNGFTSAYFDFVTLDGSMVGPQLDA